MPIKPFKSVRLPPAHGKVVSPSYLLKCFKAVLGVFNITVEGGDIVETGEGHMHLKLDGGTGSGMTPFFCSGSAGQITVAPGLVLTQVESEDGDKPAYVMPVIGGRRLDSVPPPTLAVNGTGRVVLVVEFFGLTGLAKLNTPWKIIFETFNADIPLIRNDGVNDIQDCVISIPIAEYVNGTKTTQNISTMISVHTSWNGIMVSA